MNILNNSLLGEWRGLYRFFQLPDNEKEIVFYAQGAKDSVHLKPLIKEIENSRPGSVVYLTSDSKDPYLKSPSTKAFFIGEGFARTLCFFLLKAKACVLTLPDLDTFQLKKSIFGVHYFYVFHSMCSTHMIYRKNAFDAFDTILCAGPHHLKEIRRNEAIHKLKPKNLIEYGYARLDSLISVIEQKSNLKKANSKPSVLLAPSWGPGSIIDTCAIKLIDGLLRAGFETRLRVHPMSHEYSASTLRRIRRRFSHESNFYFETDVSTEDELINADILISDWSGAALEYAFSTERPVIYIDTPKKIRNPKYSNLGLVPLEVSIRDEIGIIVSKNRVEQIPNIIPDLCARSHLFKDQIRKAKQRHVFNLGKAGVIGAKHILSRLAIT